MLGTKSSNKAEIDAIEVNGHVITDTQEIADNFNQLFSVIGTKTAEKVLSTSVDFKSFLPPPPPNSLFFYPVTPQKVIETIDKVSKLQKLYQCLKMYHPKRVWITIVLLH